MLGLNSSQMLTLTGLLIVAVFFGNKQQVLEQSINNFTHSLL